MVRFCSAAVAAFLMFFRAAAFCLSVLMILLLVSRFVSLQRDIEPAPPSGERRTPNANSHQSLTIQARRASLAITGAACEMIVSASPAKKVLTGAAESSVSLGK